MPASTLKTSTDTVSNGAGTHALGVISDVDYVQRVRTITVKLPADAAASTATEHILFTTGAARGGNFTNRNSSPVKILSMDFVGQTATAADNTDFATLELNVGDLAAGALGTAIVSKTTKAASLNGIVANTAVSFYSSTTGGTAVAADKRVVLNVTKGGAGKVIGVLLVEITYSID